jgi:hypothetical protein
MNGRSRNKGNDCPDLCSPFTEKSRLKAHGFNRVMKGGVARHPLLGMIRAELIPDFHDYVFLYRAKKKDVYFIIGMIIIGLPVELFVLGFLLKGIGILLRANPW